MIFITTRLRNHSFTSSKSRKLEVKNYRNFHRSLTERFHVFQKGRKRWKTAECNIERTAKVYMQGLQMYVDRIFSSKIKGKWQQNFLSSHLKETPKQYIEVYYRILISALFSEIFWLEIFSCPPSWIFVDMHVRHNWDHAIFFLTTQWLICSHNRMYG